MSADNGIYILKTIHGNGFEYRVAHMGAVENYEWDFLKKDESGFGLGGYTDDTKWHIFNARQMWIDPAFSSRDEAWNEARRQHDEVGYTEYGICEIFIPEEFDSLETREQCEIKERLITIAVLLGELDYEKWGSSLPVSNKLKNLMTSYISVQQANRS